MSEELAQGAINQALSGNWKAAADLNQQILEKDKEDIDALCRLAKAYTELGKKRLALQSYKKVLRLDRFNPIAKKYLVKFPKRKGKNCHGATKIDPGIFLEEPGKTKVVSLVKLGSPQILSELSIGDSICLMAKKRSISFYDKNKRYLGKIPDDLSSRLVKLIKNGNQYQAVVKSIEEKSLSAFIKEAKQSKRNIGIPSFPSSKEEYYSFAPTTIIKRTPIEEIENQGE